MNPDREEFHYWVAVHTCMCVMVGRWNISGRVTDPDDGLLKDAESISQWAYDNGHPAGTMWDFLPE